VAYSEALAERIRDVLGPREDLREQKMFGGLAFMVGGHMAVGIVGDELMLRLGEEGAEALLGDEHVRPMDFTGRPMKGFVYVGPAATRDARALRKWVAEGVAYARSLPPAARRARRPRPGQRVARARRA